MSDGPVKPTLEIEPEPLDDIILGEDEDEALCRYGFEQAKNLPGTEIALASELLGETPGVGFELLHFLQLALVESEVAQQRVLGAAGETAADVVQGDGERIDAIAGVHGLAAILLQLGEPNVVGSALLERASGPGRPA